MPRLLLRFPVEGLKMIVLKPGRNRIGRGTDNDHQVEHPSISSTHCEVIVDDGAVTIKDLDSTNGTCLDAMQIDQAELFDGQTLSLGSVEMTYYSDEQDGGAFGAGATSPRIPYGAGVTAEMPGMITASVSVASGNECQAHPGTPGAFVCRQCQRLLCTNCVKTLRAGSQALHTCLHCDGVCVPAGQHQRELARSRMTFFNSFLGAFAYPWKKNGPVLLVGGTIFFGILNGAAAFFTATGFGGLAGFLVYCFLVVVSVGYLFLYLETVITSSAAGEEDMPDWPEFSGYFDDVIKPFFRLTTTFAICLAPGLIAIIKGHPEAGFALLLMGVFLLPMALLAVGMISSLAGLNPFVIFPSILKVPLEYLTLCGVLLLVFGLQAGIDYALELTPIPILPAIVSMFVWLYGLMVATRLLGLLYYTNSKKLGWF